MLLPPSSSSPFTVPSVCHLLSRVSDLFMKHVCTTPYAVVARECLNGDQACCLFLSIEFTRSKDNPCDSVVYHRSWCWFQARAGQRIFWSWQSRTRQQRLGFAWVLAGGGSGLGCSACLLEFNFHKEELDLPMLDSDFIVPALPGMKGSIEALSQVQVPHFHLLEGSSSQAPPRLASIWVLMSKD